MGDGMHMGCTHLVLGEEGVAHSGEQHHPHEEGDHSLGGHFWDGRLGAIPPVRGVMLRDE